ncbi:MAG: hypothetical protein ACO1TE_08510 [Prosthecobacter sp.]
MDEPINPYAAPKTLLGDARRDVETARRPRSLKWATYVLGFETCLRLVHYWDNLARHGVAGTVEHLAWLDASALLIAAGWITCLVNKRNKASFYLTAFPLAFLTLVSAYAIASHRQLPLLLQAFPTLLFLILVPIFGGLVYLFCRVAFGMPSRQYFGMNAPMPEKAAAENDSREARHEP